MTAEAGAEARDAAARAGRRVAAEALGWLGTPFVHGASCRGAGCDCLGLLRGVWRALAGPEAWVVPAYAADWAEAGAADLLLAGLRTNLVACQPGHGPAAAARDGDGTGEVLLFRLRPRGPGRHVGVRTGAARFVHAHGRHGVVEDPLTPAWSARVVAVFALPLTVAMD